MKRLTVLGSTGSIGVNTLNVVRRHDNLYQIHALAAGRNVEVLLSQILEFRPALVVTESDAVRWNLRNRLAESGLQRASWPQLECGPAALVLAATGSEVDFVMSAIVGVAGLEATYEAVKAGKRIGLANKEVLVASGRLVTEAAKEAGTELIPVDSEHNGAHQCLRGGRRSEVSKLILTASGGPFRQATKEQMASVTPAQALNHPTWKMGQRITIDSATLMNKGFEVIEACWLFGFLPKEVEVVVHPQSTVHAMVEFNDGSVLAQVSATDMRMPIQYALSYPDRLEAPVPRLDWSEVRRWEFHPPDFDRFPLLRLAYQAQGTGASAPCTLNAADEIAVAAFLREEIGFTEIAAVVEESLNTVAVREPTSVGEVLEIDRLSRDVAAKIVETRRANRRVQTSVTKASTQ